MRREVAQVDELVHVKSQRAVFGHPKVVEIVIIIIISSGNTADFSERVLRKLKSDIRHLAVYRFQSFLKDLGIQDRPVFIWDAPVY